MEFYLGRTRPYDQSPRNLFSLRYDLHMPLFEHAGFVIVPKSGKLVVHFIQNCEEYANKFHNRLVDHNHTLSHEALYARFAWALLKIVKESKLNPKKFKILGPGGKVSKPGTGGNEGPSKTRHEDGDRDETNGNDNVEGNDGDGGDEDNVEGDDSDDSDDGDNSRNYKPSGSATRRQRNPDALALQSNSWLYDVLHKMAPGDDQSSLKADEREIEDDLMTAARHLPFLGAYIKGMDVNMC